jgi:hypothetical protein
VSDLGTSNERVPSAKELIESLARFADHNSLCPRVLWKPQDEEDFDMPECVCGLELLLEHAKAYSRHEPPAKPVAWRGVLDSAYELHPRYVYSDSQPERGKWEPLYAAPDASAQLPPADLLEEAGSLVRQIGRELDMGPGLKRETWERIDAFIRATATKGGE